MTFVQSHVSGASESQWMEGDMAPKLVHYPKSVASTQHRNYFFFALLFGHPRGFTFTMQITTGCVFPHWILPVFYVHIPTDVVTDPRVASSYSFMRKIVKWTKGVYLIGIVMRRKSFPHSLQDETKITLFKSMELLHNYINSSENQAEPQVLGFCSLFRKTNGYELSWMN